MPLKKGAHRHTITCSSIKVMNSKCQMVRRQGLGLSHCCAFENPTGLQAQKERKKKKKKKSLSKPLKKEDGNKENIEQDP